MRVRDVMTRNVTTCTPDSSLAGVASRMWLGECGAVPVVDGDRRVLGIVTDRDICFAVAGTERPAAEIKAKELLARPRALHTCGPEEDVEDAIALMREARVRRLPVVDGEGRLVGILSMTDAVLHTAGQGAIAAENVLGTLRTLGRAPARALDEAELHA
jgi:CBS domain-containing protein